MVIKHFDVSHKFSVVISKSLGEPPHELLPRASHQQRQQEQENYQTLQKDHNSSEEEGRRHALSQPTSTCHQQQVPTTTTEEERSTESHIRSATLKQPGTMRRRVTLVKEGEE